MFITSLLTRQRGFTMVELLVVISIIGILATAVLAALNPVEQLRKARDTSRKADAQTVLGAVDRFQATFGCYPWAFDTTTSLCNAASAPNTAYATTLAIAGSGNGVSVTETEFTGATGALNQLRVKDELKTQFSDRSTVANAEMWLSVDANNQASVCFQPESKTARGGGLGPVRTIRNVETGASCAGTYSVPPTAATTCAVCVPQ